jgi:pyridoxine/pyridoxamine 5'-phosphate oxidase
MYKLKKASMNKKEKERVIFLWNTLDKEISLDGRIKE